MTLPVNDEAARAEVPANPPGQPALAYRLTTQGELIRRMLARLPAETIADGPNQGTRPLAALTTRAAADPAIACLEAWAAVADVLTFYQERLANEGFLRTATERRSVLELARAIGYELGPGLAAGTYLAFLLEEPPGTVDTSRRPPGTRAKLEAGLKVMSVPGQDETPHLFETVETIEARAEWNRLWPQRTAPQIIDSTTRALYLRGANLQLQPGDTILLCGDERLEDGGSERWDIRTLKTVEAHPEADYTRIAWDEPLGIERGRRSVAPAASAPAVFVFRQQAALFGHNAPDWRAVPETIKRAYVPEGPLPDDWPGFEIPDSRQRVIDLDAAYPKSLADSWAALVKPDYAELYRVRQASLISRTDFTLTAKVTRLKVDTGENLSRFGLRETQVLAQSEALPLADQPLETPVQGQRVALDRPVAGLERGRALIFSGRRASAGPADETAGEVAFVETVAHEQGRTVITLSAPLKHGYERAGLVIYANAIRATHGETVKEVLGSGDARPHQRFELKKPPLTYVPAPTPGGARSTLTVRVNDVAWSEVPSLYGCGPHAQCYAVQLDDQGRAEVIFGDGEHGARPPSGVDNIVAEYRTGLGLAGQVRAGSLSLLQSRPLGVRDVTNPLPASGAADPERLDQARANAPLAVLTLDRIVSLQDFEDFTRAFAGIGKAQAAAVWSGETGIIHITAASAGGAPIEPESALMANLIEAIDRVRDPSQQVVVAGYQPLQFDVHAKLLLDPRREEARVLADARAALLAAFGFGQRVFGQAVTAAEVIRVLQAVPGVEAVDLDQLAAPDSGLQGAGGPLPFLAAATAGWDGQALRPAQLLTVNPNGIVLSDMEARP